MPLRTHTYFKCLEHKANMFEIQNWELPYDFGSVEDEIVMVRERAGFTDYSFNNLLAVTGSDAFSFLQKMIVGDMNKAEPGQAIYSILVDEAGNILDEVTIFRIDTNHFFYNGEAPFKTRSTEWLKKYSMGKDVQIIPLGTCLMPFQGPKSREILQRHVNVEDLSRFSFKDTFINDIPVRIVRLGFSGELGYEFYVDPEYTGDLWETLMDIGKQHDVGPYGIAATFTLGIEKGYLFDNDYYEGASPLELGLGWTIAFNKEGFIGKQALIERKNKGLKTKLIAFEVMASEIIAEEKDVLLKNGEKVGEVTIAGPGLSIGKTCIGRAWIKIEHAIEGEELDLEHNGERTKVRVSLNKDWYDPENIKVKS